MTEEYIVPRPAGAKPDGPRYAVSLTKDADCVFILRRRDTDNNPVDWDSDVWVFIDIGRTTQRIDAVVTGAEARVRIESDVADQIRDGAGWRAIRSTDGTPTLERPLMVGWFERHDGGRPE